MRPPVHAFVQRVAELRAREAAWRAEWGEPRIGYVAIHRFQEATHDDALAAHQEGRYLNAALRDLPDDQREILTLAFVDELSQSQIARKLGLPLGTVKSRMRLAYGKLMRALEDLR